MYVSVPYKFIGIGITVLIVWILIKFDNRFNEQSDIAKLIVKMKNEEKIAHPHVKVCNFLFFIPGSR